jgi:predicted Zn-dependent peptidase
VKGETIRTFTLSSGLPVLSMPRRSLHQASLALFMRVGSRYETPADNGISHFLEHMMYRGTTSMATSHDQALAFERLGGTLYAATATDHGLMALTLPPETLLDALPLLGEVLTQPRFSAIEIERRIVHEEILESLDDEGRKVDPDDLSREVLFEGHSLGYPIIGTPATLESFDEPRLRAWHAAHYVVENSVLALAGAYDEDKLIPALERALAALPRGARRASGPAPLPRSGQGPKFRYVDSDGSQTDVRLAFHAPGDHDADEPATEVLLRVIDDGMSTRLYERMCDEKGLSYDVSAAFEAFEDAGVLDFAAETQHARTADVTDEMLRLASELAAHGPTDAEIDKIRSRARWHTRGMLDDASGLAQFLGLAQLATVAATPDARCEQLCAVTREQVRDAAQKIFQPDRLAAIAVGVLTRAEQKRVEKVVKAFR